MTAGGVQVERGQRFRWDIGRRSALGGPSSANADPLLLHILRRRGQVEPGQIAAFLSPAEQPLGAPESMADLARAVTRLCQALDHSELIAVYGDYDVDGLTAAAVLCETLGRLGGRVLPFIPHRQRDGYGLSDGPLGELPRQGPAWRSASTVASRHARKWNAPALWGWR